jgi:adenylate kinase family enzyme
MRIVLLCGPPCSGKTTLAHHLAQPADVVLDYDDMARALGSPVWWQHPEPYRTMAEQHMQTAVAHALATPRDGTAWVIRTAPRPAQRARLAQQWHAQAYLLNPGETECKRPAVEAQRPSGTRRAIGVWYHRYSPWPNDLNPATLDPEWVSVEQHRLVVDPRAV